MKITNGDKITIKNIGKIAVDIPTFKHNFSYRLSGGESLVFPTKSVEQSLFYLKQKNKILQVTLGNGGEESLTPFRVGQTISGVTIDPTAKTDEEMIEWLNTLPYEGSTLKLVGYGDGNNDIIAISDFSDMGIEGNYPKMLRVILGDASYVLFNTNSYELENTPAGTITIPQGWSCFSYNDNDVVNPITITPIIELTTYNNESPEATIFNTTISAVVDEFAFLNGTVLGAVEGEPHKKL